MKKKIYAVFFIFAIILSISGCAEPKSEDIEGVVKDSETQSSDEIENNDMKTINQEIVNDDAFKAVLIDIKKEHDDIWGDSIKIKFELENKSDLTVEVQSREVSVDGKMVDDIALSMSQEISPGKTADGILTITEYEGEELPKMEENLEMILHVFSWDDMDYQKDYPLTISF